MPPYAIKIKWKGPYDLQYVIEELNDKGTKEDYWSGEDYGLYQIYGKHILCGNNVLLYIGKAFKQTFSRRFKDHQKWLKDEENIKIYVGRIHDQRKHTKKNRWQRWEKDIELAEKILIYKYSPHYNSMSVSEPPKFKKKILIQNVGAKNDLRIKDNAPGDF